MSGYQEHVGFPASRVGTHAPKGLREKGGQFLSTKLLGVALFIKSVLSQEQGRVQARLQRDRHKVETPETG